MLIKGSSELFNGQNYDNIKDILCTYMYVMAKNVWTKKRTTFVTERKPNFPDAHYAILADTKFRIFIMTSPISRMDNSKTINWTSQL
jgi:hypothetical protein